MAVYDENLQKNPFYLALEKQRPDLCSRVAELHGIILVPCRGSLTLGTYTAAQFETYVLQPSGGGYQTVDGKELTIKDSQVRLGAGFQAPANVTILFEETFYNEKEQSYSVLCIARPIDADQSPVEASPSPAPYCLKNVEDVREFLGRHAEKLDKFVSSFCHSFKEQERKGLRHHIDSVNALYTKCLQCLLRDSRLKVLAKQELQMTLLKQAVEMYIHHGIHDLIFNFVGSLEASQDAAFNKTTRGLQDLQQKDLGVKSEFSINIPRAKRELSQLNRCTSPLHKLLCLRKVALIIMQSPSHTVSIEAVCADDLLSVILYLLVKTEIPNWMANLSYIKNFHFCNSTKDELSYCLTSFEAAIEFISQGNLNLSPGRMGSGDLNDKVRFTQKLNLLSQNAATPIDCLFQHIADGNEAEVQRMLSENESDEDEIKMCHPLCSCDHCELRVSGRLNDPSIVTPFSRDDRGYTPLHVAAICGHSLLIDLLVSKGALVNATDYHALSPLHLSCQKGYQGVTLLLLHYKANTDAQDNNGNTALHLACMYGHEDCVKALVYYDLHTCRLNIQNDKGDTPLHIAARWGYEGIMEVLLENGASTAVYNKAKDSPLQCALNSKILMLLETHNSSCKRESSDSPNRSPQGSHGSSRRSSVSSTTSQGSEAKPDCDRVRHKEVEKLLRAVADGDVEMVRYLLEWLDEEPEEEGARAPSWTELCHPLCQCPQCGPTQKKLSCLQASGLGVNSSSADGFTPLHVAALHGHTALVSLLSRHGANVNARNCLSATPLHLASQNRHIQVVASLLECNAKLNKKDHYGNTPLIHACLRGHLDTAEILLQSNASVNLANNQGNTALHEAVRGGHLALVELLLQAGAQVHIRNKRQRTALDCATETGGKNTEILRSLQKASGLSPDAEPIKMLSVPKGALAHSFVQRLKPQRDTNGRRQKLAQSINRVQQMKKGLPRDSSVPSVNSPTSDRRRLRRGETLGSSGPFSISSSPEGSPLPGAPRDKERTLSRSYTVDTEHLSSPQWGQGQRQAEVREDTQVVKESSHIDASAEPVYTHTDVHAPDASNTHSSDVHAPDASNTHSSDVHAPDASNTHSSDVHAPDASNTHSSDVHAPDASNTHSSDVHAPDASDTHSSDVHAPDASDTHSSDVHAPDASNTHSSDVHAPDASNTHSSDVHAPDASNTHPSDVHAPDASNTHSSDVPAPDASNTHSSDVPAPDASNTHSSDVHAPDASNTHSSDVHAPDLSNTHSSDVHAPDLSNTHPSDVHAPDLSNTHSSDVHAPDLCNTHPSDVHAPDASNTPPPAPSNTRPSDVHAPDLCNTRPSDVHAPDLCNTRPSDVHAPDLSNTHSSDVHAPDASNTHPSDVHAPDASNTHPSDVHAPDLSNTHSSDVHAPDLSNTHSSDVHAPDLSNTHSSDVHAPDASNTHTSDVHAPDLCNTRPSDVHAPAPSNTRPSDVHAPDLCNTHPSDVHAPDLCNTHPSDVHALDASNTPPPAPSNTRPSDVHAPDLCNTHPSDVHAPDLCNTHPSDVHAPDFSNTHPSDVHAPDLCNTHTSDVHAPDLSNTHSSDVHAPDLSNTHSSDLCNTRPSDVHAPDLSNTHL
ncbi:ankyrin repeat domain-containing protein 27 isoform X3 [Esox lucius]|uniref:ankyrin repeat domain-containing protein 27 isoform X3 n=1 Tax=Esox lucius TaxID=8010 RepID=UPI0014778272|nr:ankyrin repeat domain-containing protein 27 isoform X3 [Esox lucius]